MENSKQNLIVTLADKNYIDQAKQMFSSVYKNANWQGDYMLLTDNIDKEIELEFKNKGIIVYTPPLIDNTKFSPEKKYPSLLLSKLYLFKSDFKKWKHIIFIDSDVIVNASLDALLQKPGFNAPNAETFTLKNEFKNDKKVIKKLKLNKDFNLKTRAFNSGIFSFDTSLINPETFSELLAIYEKYKYLCVYGEESVLNLYFYKKWNKLSDLYNFNPFHFSLKYKIDSSKVTAIITHFYYKYKPWHEDNLYYANWKRNRLDFNSIDLNNRLPGKTIEEHELQASNKYINLKKSIYNIKKIILFLPLLLDSLVGKLGLLVKHINPSLYSRISLKKDDKQ